MTLERQKRTGEAWETVIADDAVSGAYGELVITGNATPTAMATQNDWFQVVAGWAADQHHRCTLNAGAGTLSPTIPAVFATMCTVAFTTDDDLNTLEFGLFRDGVLIPDHKVVTWIQNAIYPISVTITGVDPIVAGAVLDLRVRCVTNNNVAIVVTDCNYSIFSVAVIP